MHEYAIPSLAPGHAVMSRNTGRIGEVLDLPWTLASIGERVLLVAWEDGTVCEVPSGNVVNLGPTISLEG